MVKLTLEITVKQALDILALLDDSNTSSDLHISPVQALDKKEIQIPREKIKSILKATSPSPKTGIKMPTFGRTASQIKQFEETEIERVEKEQKSNKAKEEKAKAKKKQTKEAEALKLAGQQLDSTIQKLAKPTWKL